MSEPILSLRNVVQSFPGRRTHLWKRSVHRALDDVSLEVFEGETLAIVGESGSGKSTLAKLLLNLRQPTAGGVFYRGNALAGLDPNEHRTYRREVQAVFQDPAGSLNPQMKVQQLLGDVVRRHRLVPAAREAEFVAEQLRSVGLEPPEKFLARHPHQLSGGQQQRVAIARSMMLEPRIIVADEPLSSLDISVQAQVVELMMSLREKTGIGFVIISHDLHAMEAIADRVAVMKDGRIVELGTHVFDDPQHPYTQSLLKSRLTLDPREARRRLSVEG
jgi:ABC-type glutathione transport system ATPase component